MALLRPILAASLLLLLENFVESAESPPNTNDDTSSIPMIASGKRQHNIMRFGKRPAGGHNLIHFGKRRDTPPQHSFLYFGKKSEEEQSLPNIYQYLSHNRDPSYKRGHTIMRFGKRAPSHNIIRFGRSDDDDDYDDIYPNEATSEEEKRGGHSMLYFGKRGGHSMLYFGKRVPGHSILSFGKRDNDKRAHSMIHFGKRDDEDDDDVEKRAHSMIHFGKRDEDDENFLEEVKRGGSHSMIHFGKRDYDEDPLPFFLNPAISEKRQHNLLRFGKKTDGLRKGSHAMIHFGKRDEDKRAHSMIHFGKRSVDENNDLITSNQSEANEKSSDKIINRMKRNAVDIDENSSPVLELVGYDNPDETGEPANDDIENALGNIPYHLSYPYVDQDPGLLPIYPDYHSSKKDADSKNVFLRFG